MLKVWHLIWDYFLLAIPAWILLHLALNRYWPDDPRWTLWVPSFAFFLLGLIAGKRGAASKKLVTQAIRERLEKGGLTGGERLLAQKYYDDFRDALTRAAIHRDNALQPGESAHLVLKSKRPEDCLHLLNNIRIVHAPMPPLEDHEESLLIGFARENPALRCVVIQWLFASHGPEVLRRLTREGLLKDESPEVSESVLSMLPKMPDYVYSEAVAYLAEDLRKPHLRGHARVLEPLREGLQRCWGSDYENTVAVIGAINGDQGRNVFIESLKILDKSKHERIERELVNLQAAILVPRLKPWGT